MGCKSVKYNQKQRSSRVLIFYIVGQQGFWFGMINTDNKKYTKLK